MTDVLSVAQFRLDQWVFQKKSGMRTYKNQWQSLLNILIRFPGKMEPVAGPLSYLS